MSAELPTTGACFDAAAFRALGKAYDDACGALGFVFHTYDESDALAVKEQLARHVIASAAAGETNPRKLAAMALSKMPALEAKWGRQWSDSGVQDFMSARRTMTNRMPMAVYAPENAL